MGKKHNPFDPFGLCKMFNHMLFNYEEMVDFSNDVVKIELRDCNVVVTDNPEVAERFLNNIKDVKVINLTDIEGLGG